MNGSKFSQTQLRYMSQIGIAQDITDIDNMSIKELITLYGDLKVVGFSSSAYGYNGLLLSNRDGNAFFTITNRSSALFYFI